ncbi:putative rmlC-like jelly roll protein [Rosa chinensis]|uniref:Putative rmlC-like jelly roll protein n=1 Tax=Rosa chinensis TaxID=74649 RepID=A0A2P6RMK4_ROSCH|nr:vicilin-like seed storage protein At2g18540 [Rosa chinensis]PRQ47662.1 putative rmlC-like jelly roll protein [Rosa chinensis]
MVQYKMSNNDSNPPFSLTLFILFFFLSLPAFSSSLKSLKNEEDFFSSDAGYLVRRAQRRALVQTEYGEISSIDVTDGRRGPYHVQFIIMEPNSLFLPVLLHSDMVFYVHTGSGRLNWAHGKDDQINEVPLKQGDIHRLRPGSVFFVQSDLQTERQKLRINAIFANSDDDVFDPTIGAYSSVRDLVRGFDTKILRSAFQVSEDVIKSITNSTDQSAIIHAVPTKKETFWDLEARFLKTFIGASYDGMALNKKKHKKKEKSKTYNIFDEDPDFKNCNGWSLTVNERNSPSLTGSNIGLFMVNLTKGSMMGPHWNPRATEIAVVLQGQGMVRVVCASTAKRSECRNLRFRVHEGDVFAVPMFHPMAQMSYNNDSFVFMGFSTTTRRNYPQFLAGKYSVLQTLNRQVLAVSLNVTNTTIDQLLAAQTESIILDCTSCAEKEEKVMLEEIEKEREEEEAKKREEQRKREEEQRKREEEQRQREEEEARKKEEEEERRKREEEEERRKREEEEEEERRRREEERREEEEQERERQQEEGGEAAEREQEEARRQEEEAESEKEDTRRQQQEEYSKRKEKEAQTEQEEARKQQEEIEGRTRPEEQETEGDQRFDGEAGRREI